MQQSYWLLFLLFATAVDPDGNLVIFINGNHFEGSTPGGSYWRTTQTTPNLG